MTDQIAFETTEFADNPEPRCPCLLLLDTSASMSGAPIAELNAGLTSFRDELAADSLATKRVEIGMVTFGPVATELDFQTAEHFQAPTLTTKRDTPMGEAILHALKMIEDRKQDYRDNGVSYYRPWVFMITDGAPTDEWQAAATAIREGEASKAFAFFPIGVGGADIETLKQISSREPLMLDGLRFRDLFSWLSNSLRSVSQSTPGTEVPLESPSGWAAV